jgi:transposase
LTFGEGQARVMGSRVALFEQIRRDALREGLSIRELSRRHGVGRPVVRQALASSIPPPRKTPVRRSPKLDPVKVHIDAMLLSDVTAPRKQRHTARRVLARLLDEHGARDITYSAVRDYVARRRPEIAANAGVEVENAFVLQTHPPGAEAEVDFGDVYVSLAGQLTKCFLFTLRLSSSGKACHQVFASQGQEAFIEGHADAFIRLGGVPYDKIRYDNLKSAVTRVLFGRNRVESDRWVAFRSHMGFDAFYCRPGVVGAHEKGGVEGEVGRFRRNHLTPVPVVPTLAELNARLVLADAADDARRIENRVHTVGEDFAAEAPLLRPLPSDKFDAGLWLTPVVDRYSRVSVRQCHYSVPASLIGRTVRVSLRASELVICDGRREIARHPRLTRKGSQSLTLDHYLEVLVRMPGALPGATALVQARESGVFTTEHEAFWALARKAHGDFGGTQAIIEVLLLHRHLPHADVVTALGLVVAVGGTTADVVAVEARKLARLRPGSDVPAEPPVEPRRVVSLTERRLLDPAAVIARLPPDTRPLPSVAAYDELLPRRVRPPPDASSTQGAVS